MESRRLLVAFALSLAILIAWGYMFPPSEPAPPAAGPISGAPGAESGPGTAEPEARPPEDPGARDERRAMPPAESADQPAEEAPEAAPVEARSEERPEILDLGFRAVMTNRGAQMVSFELEEHRSNAGGPVDLVRQREVPRYPYGLVDSHGEGHPLNDVLWAVERSMGELGEQVVTFRYRGAAGVAEKRFSFRPDGMYGIDVTVGGDAGWGMILGPGIRNPSAQETENRFARRSAVYRLTESMETVDPQRAKEVVRVPGPGLRWVGIQDTYFLTALVPDQGLAQVVIQPYLAATDPGGTVFEPFPVGGELSEAQEAMGREVGIILQAEGETFSGTAYWGPKQYDQLSALPYGLEETINLGWFKFLSKPLLFGLGWIHDNVVGNYGWAIILMTILIRIILFPLMHKSTVSMQKMQRVNPKVQAIRAKYRPKLKDKKGRPNAEMQRKMNEEMMALYKTEGVNPAGGCLPMILQIPVLFAFYNILSAAIELRHAPWILWIVDLSAKDPYYVLPIVMGASQFLQQKMTPTAGDPMQRRMFALMPIFFTVLFLGFPSGLVIYWLTNNILGITQQVIYKRFLYPDEEKSGTSATGKSNKGAKS